MSSIFTLKTEQSQLSSSNYGMNDMKYIQYAPTRDVTGNNFANGAQYIKWSVSGNRWFVPSRSYLRFRFQLVDNVGDQFSMSSNIAPNMGICANLFQSIEFRINEETLTRISDYVPQIDALKKRMNKSKSWLDSVGSSTGMYQAKTIDRQKEISSDGNRRADDYTTDLVLDAQLGSIGVVFTFLDLVGPNQVTIAANGTITFTQAGGDAIPDLRNFVKEGQYLLIDDGANKIRKILDITAATIVVSVAEGNLTPVGAANYVAQVRFVNNYPIDSRRVSQFECIWQPPLCVFDMDTALPAGRYQLSLNPQNINSYQKMAIESLLGDRSTANFSFSVVDMYFYSCEVQGPRIENMSYYLDLDEIRCQKRNVTSSGGLSQEEFTVSSSTNKLTVAFQDTRVNNDAQYSSSRFKINAQQSDELQLNRLFVNYAGQNKPQTDADPSYKFTDVEDYTVQRYMDTIVYTGKYFDCGGAESIQDWHDRGAYYHWVWPKDATDRSNRVFCNYQFNNNIDNASILLFNHYKKAALITIENGNTTMVKVQEM